MEAIKPKAVTIISGFLGAGKTTFLNAWINHSKSMRPVIIENEFGKEGIDADLIVSAGADIFELNNGCLCCNLNEDLYDLLSDLWQRREEFDELIIETTGIADPATVADVFITTPLSKYYQLERVICLADAQLVEYELEETLEARKQIVFSDIILLNKSDTIHSGRIRELASLLNRINPFATVFSGNKETGYPLTELLSLTRDDFDTRLNTLTATKEPHAEKTTAPGEHQHRHITSLSFVFKEPFDLETFEYRLIVFLNLQAADIYRLKGFIHIPENNRKIIVQSVGSMLAITEGSLWEEREEKLSRLVVIGRSLKAKGFDKMLRACLVRDYSKAG